MSSEGKTIRLASSWKEIAAYLGVTVRTAQNWERERGLPVQRFPGSNSRVFADLDALDAWRMGAKPQSEPEQVNPRKRLGVLAGLLTICLVSAAAYWWPRPVDPSSWAVENGALVVRDDRGRELWRHSFGNAVVDYPTYQRMGHTLGWIGDLDGDGTPEVIFGLARARPLTDKSDELLCFSNKGELRWRFVLGQSAERFDSSLRPPYQLENLLTLNQDGLVRGVIVNGVHHMWYPSHITLVSPLGQMIREYWHAGHLRYLALLPRTSGAPVILAGGISNSYHAATLVGLNPNTFGGVSEEENKAYQLPGPSGSEVIRVLFPRTCISQAKEPYNKVDEISILPSGVQIGVQEENEFRSIVFHSFDRNLVYQGASMSSNFEGRHRMLERMKVLDHSFHGDAEVKALSHVRVLTSPSF